MAADTGVTSSARAASRMKGTSAPRARATSAISALSVVTTTLSKRPLPRAASTVYASRGLPRMGLTFFLGSLFEPPLAGITARRALRRASCLGVPPFLPVP